MQAGNLISTKPTLNQEPQIFTQNGWKIRTIQDSGELWFVASDITKILDIRNTTQSLNKLDEDERAMYYIGHREGDVNIINESGFYSLILRSRKPEAKSFKKWVTSEVLPEIRKTGSYNHNEPEVLETKEQLDCQLLAIDYCKKMLNFNEASTLQLVHKAMRDNNLSTAALPEYVESKDVMFSATDLLKKINADITTQTFNKLMVKAGYLEIKERTKANKKETKKFKALTGPGLYYGENVTAPQNKLEVTPRYFESKFDELYDKILVFA